jgi:hypothetical protein
MGLRQRLRDRAGGAKIDGRIAERIDQRRRRRCGRQLPVGDRLNASKTILTWRLLVSATHQPEQQEEDDGDAEDDPENIVLLETLPGRRGHSGSAAAQRTIAHPSPTCPLAREGS